MKTSKKFREKDMHKCNVHTPALVQREPEKVQDLFADCRWSWEIGLEEKGSNYVVTFM